MSRSPFDRQQTLLKPSEIDVFHRAYDGLRRTSDRLQGQKADRVCTAPPAHHVQPVGPLRIDPSASSDLLLTVARFIKTARILKVNAISHHQQLSRNKFRLLSIRDSGRDFRPFDRDADQVLRLGDFYFHALHGVARADGIAQAIFLWKCQEQRASQRPVGRRQQSIRPGSGRLHGKPRRRRIIGRGRPAPRC